MPNPGDEQSIASRASGPDRSRSLVIDLARLQMLSRVVEQVGEGVVVSDNDGWFLYVNPTFATQHAGTVDELTGAHLSDFYRDEDLADVQPIIAAALKDGIGRGAVTRRRRDGTVFPAHITLSLLLDEGGTLIGRVLCVQDVTEQRELEEQLRQQALYDPLTGLPNRRLLRDRVEHALVLKARRHTGVAAVFVDLDAFKDVNDTYGHEIGDEVLVTVARRLVNQVRQCDTSARYGGDEYVLLLEELVDAQHATKISERLLMGFSQPVPTAAGSLAVSASFGIRFATADDDYDELVRRADEAMYEAKRSGKGCIRLSRS